MFGISAFAEAPFASLAGQTVVVAITGVGASGAVGTVVYSPLVTAAITGVQGSGAVGSVTETNAVGLNGAQAAGQPGSIGVLGVEAGIQGAQAAGAVGTVGMGERFVALSGVVANGAVGDVVETNSPTEDGVVATGSVGIMLARITVSISGVSARGQLGTFDEFYWTTIDDSETPNWQNVAMTV
jgi:hypothetical protein